MNIDSFFRHHGLECNPFDAEEARLDPLFERLQSTRLTHPDFAKILGTPDRPSTSVVFGEKGSGKTAIRLLIGRRVHEHNTANPDRRVLVVDYDDLNPVLDRVMRARRQDATTVLKTFRLADHQDAILSRAVTKLVSSLLGQTPPSSEPTPLPDDVDKRIKRMPRQHRVDLAVLAALYDQPRTGSVVERWKRLRSKLRLGWRMPSSALAVSATVVSLIAAALLVGWLIVRESVDEPWWLIPAMGLAIAAALLAWGWWAYGQLTLWWLCRHIQHEMPAVERSVGELRQMLGELSSRERARQPFPTAIAKDDGKIAGDIRYQLTRRLVDLLHPFGYVSMLVLVDRVDEPTMISGNPEKMRSVVWPMLDNKFLQQEGIGLKLLLPLDLRHLLHRESAEFFREARLDKQNMIDRLDWTGAILYDLCSARLRACRTVAGGDGQPSTDFGLTDLFEPSVTREMLIDALDQMHQPRDAFKFLYQVLQEHCRLVPEDQADFKIARLTLETVRRTQSQRIQELYRGLTPA